MGSVLEQRHWGVSILQFTYNDIKDFRLAFANTANILNEFVVGKFKFEDLDEILASGNEKALQSRIAAIEMSKSVINAVMLGTNEDYIRDSASVAGLADLLDRFMMTVSMATGYPVTKLFGRSASGLNATGEGDQKSYYDMIRSEMVGIKPEIQRFIDIIADWKGLSDEDHTYTWGNLYQPTPEEEANFERIKAETFRTNTDGYQRLMADAVLTPEQVYTELGYEEKFGKYVEPELPDIDDMGDDINASNAEGNDPQGTEESDPSPEDVDVPKKDSMDVSDESRKGFIDFLKEFVQRFSHKD
jgi:phage-related protein (TIGR01555 family)